MLCSTVLGECQCDRGINCSSARSSSSVSERLAALHQIRAAVAADVRRQIAEMVDEEWPIEIAAEAVVRWWTGEIHRSARDGAVLGMRDHRGCEA